MQTELHAIETDMPTLYEEPVYNNIGKLVTVRIDTLEILKECWGSDILRTRNLTYLLVSGSCTEKRYRRVMESYYNRYYAFMNDVDSAITFCEDEPNILRDVIKPARERIDKYAASVLVKIQNAKGTVVMRTHDYIYATFSTKPDLDIKLGVKFI